MSKLLVLIAPWHAAGINMRDSEILERVSLKLTMSSAPVVAHVCESWT